VLFRSAGIRDIISIFHAEIQGLSLKETGK
jgi:hypothetical protein